MNPFFVSLASFIIVSFGFICIEALVVSKKFKHDKQLKPCGAMHTHVFLSTTITPLHATDEFVYIMNFILETGELMLSDWAGANTKLGFPPFSSKSDVLVDKDGGNDGFAFVVFRFTFTSYLFFDVTHSCYETLDPSHELDVIGMPPSCPSA